MVGVKMVKTAKVMAAFTVLAALLSGCSQQESKQTSISNETQNIFDDVFSDHIDIPIITADGYDVASGEINLSEIGEAFVGGMLDSDNLIVLCEESTKLALYNISEKTINVLAESEASDTLVAAAGFNEHYLCYIDYHPYSDYVGYTWNYVDLTSGETKAFFSSDDTVWTFKNAAVVGDKIYFQEVEYIEDGVYSYNLYEYDIATDEASVFSEDSCYPQIYNDSLAFIKDDSQIVVYEDGEINPLIDLRETDLYQNSFGIGISGDIVTYSFQIHDSENPEIAATSGVGFISDNKRVDLISGTKAINWAENLRFGNNGYAVWNNVGDGSLPVFYDANENAFVVVSGELSRYAAFAAEDAIIFTAYEQDDIIKYYIVKAKS